MARQNIIDKHSIKSIINPLKQIIDEYEMYMVSEKDVEQKTKDELINIGKSLIIIRDYMSIYKIGNGYLNKLLLTDIYTSLYCLKNNFPERFFYMSLRSAIESFIRLNSTKSGSKNIDMIFEDFKEKNSGEIANNELYKDCYSRIRSLYSTASAYIHGNEKVDINLKSSIDEINNEIPNGYEDTMLSELREAVTLIKQFYLIKDNDIEYLKHEYRLKIPALKFLFTSKEIKVLLEN
ncbi:hypothetical protein [Alkalibacillus haloalkaliphilus]|uniref:hypothetical protein n=1 Tax=Alkalibacillus haloalkaliphilus TaxID=94136 RepID=UPI002935642B|nr:hypothetical protein [Alkalibacillus haloalkaliphilus]MDV2581407.1 hypothetical protein [Alkalibacillus haloalkaliphilus]